MRIATKRMLATAGALCLLGACGGGGGKAKDDGGGTNKDDGGGGGDKNDAAPAQPKCDAPISGTNLALQPVVNGLSHPVFLTAAPNDPRLFVIEQPGVIKIIKDDQVSGDFLDIQDRVYSIGKEQGLLGLAFHPDYPSDPRFFVDYVADNPSGGNDPYKTVIAEFKVSSSDPNKADVSSEKVLLEIPQHHSNHNGGMLAFGPDGDLYVSLGDGGGSDDNDDPDQPQGHGQDPTTLLATLLRLDVSTPGEYKIPADNPFADGNDGAPEVYAYGLRNPWRFSFDRKTGDLYIGDVGQGSWEEVDYMAAGTGNGANFGWRLKEGTHCHNPSTNCDPGGLVEPVTEYDHGSGSFSGQAVMGGYVYRGSCLPDIQGWYFYGDYSRNKIFKLEIVDGAATAVENLTSELNPTGGVGSFGEDATGELYVLSRDGGRVSRLVAAGQ